MEKSPNLVLKLSLEEMALRRFVVKLWNEKDILLSLSYLKFYNIYGKQFQLEWRDNVECRVKDKVSKLVLPELLKERMMYLVRPIGFEIQRWIISFDRSMLICFKECFDLSILEQLCWTSTGAVDFQKTVENLVLNVISNVEKKYKLACKYCLVDLIKPSWEELSKNSQHAFYNENTFWKTATETYWTYFLKGKESELNSIYKRKFHGSIYLKAFTNSVIEGNKAATKYFFQKLTAQERDHSLFAAVIDIITVRYYKQTHLDREFHEVVCFLLSQMSFKQQVEVFKAHPTRTLRCFLNWPLQDLFLDIEDKIRPFLSERHYLELYVIVGDAANWGFYFPKLMLEFLLRIPKNFRRLFLFRFVSIFLDFADIETIRVLFKNVDLDDREHFVRDFQFSEILRNLITKDKWQIAEACLRALSLSKEEKTCLKGAFFWFLNFTERSPNEKWERLLEFLDETDASACGKTEDETLPKVKKLCTEEKRHQLSSN